MAVFCNNNGSTTSNARNVEKTIAGKTKDGKTIYEVTYENSAGETEGYVSIQTDRGEKFLQWSGYKIKGGRKEAWHYSRTYDASYARNKNVSELPLV